MQCLNNNTNEKNVEWKSRMLHITAEGCKITQKIFRLQTEQDKGLQVWQTKYSQQTTATDQGP